VLAELGLTRVINVSGAETGYGASPVCAEVLAAVTALGPHWADMRELRRAASAAIASAFECEAGAVTHCSAAGIAMAIAGCMTGEDQALIHQLPDTTGLKNAVVLQCGHRIDYGAPIRQNITLTGARVVEIGTDTRCVPADLIAALTPQTAAALFVVSHHTAPSGMIDVATFCRLCHDAGVPAIVDAAAEPDIRPFLSAGADLVITSVHKRFAGLTSAIVAGKAALVRACLAQESGIGRPMKAGKEAVIGVIAALERWRDTNPDVIRAGLAARLARGQAGLAEIAGLTATIVPDAVSDRFSRLHVTVQPEIAGLTAATLAARLRTGSPAIIVREAPTPELLQLDFRHVSDEMVDAVVAAIAVAVAATRTG
jgi:L-seryl-tRNA(Ser) seleniumtransferase